MMNIHPLIAALGAAGQTGDGATPSTAGAGVPFVLSGADPATPGGPLGQIIDPALLAQLVQEAQSNAVALDPEIRAQMAAAALAGGVDPAALEGADPGLDRAAIVAASALPVAIAAQAQVSGAEIALVAQGQQGDGAAPLQGPASANPAMANAQIPTGPAAAGQTPAGGADLPAAAHAAAAARYSGQGAAAAMASPSGETANSPAAQIASKAPKNMAVKSAGELPPSAAGGLAGTAGQAGISPSEIAAAAVGDHVSNAAQNGETNSGPAPGAAASAAAMPGPGSGTIPNTLPTGPASAAAPATPASSVAGLAAQAASSGAARPAGDGAGPRADRNSTANAGPKANGPRSGKAGAEAGNLKAGALHAGQAVAPPVDVQPGLTTAELAQARDEYSGARAGMPADTVSSSPRAGEPGPAPTAFTQALNRAADPSAVNGVPLARSAVSAAPADQVAVHITRAAETGVERVTIQLKPASLGTITVNVEMGSDNKIMAAISVERQDTLDLLQRDARALERALNDAGLKTDSGSLSFNLRGEGDQRDFRQALAGRQGSETGESNHDESQAIEAGAARMVPAGRVDIRV